MTPYFEAALAPFATHLADPNVVEIMVQEPGGFWVERFGSPHLERVACAEIETPRLARLARLVAGASSQEVGPHKPLLSAVLPHSTFGGGERIQFVLPPAAPGGVVVAIRKQVVQDLRLDAYGGDAPATSQTSSRNAELADLAKAGDAPAFLKAAIGARETILISGGTSSGKTTLLNALLAEIPATERIVTIEDAPELTPPQHCTVRLIASRGGQGTAQVDMTELLEAALRLRPDRILMGELRGREAGAFLRAINTGHQGSLTTIHADSPEAAYEQLALMVLQSGLNLSRAEILAYVRAIIRVVVQTARIGAERRITALHYGGAP